MRTTRNLGSPITYLIVAAMVLLVQGCGQPVAEDQGCPNGTVLATATDTITAPGDVTFTGESFVGARYGGGPVQLTPLTFLVSDANGPRNNVCLFAYTGDTAAISGPTWFTDQYYSTALFGVGPFNARAIVTDDTGAATVYWESGFLPMGNPRVVSSVSGTTITYTAGADQHGTSFIQIQSGTKDATFNFTWTVQGEPEQ